MTSSEQHILEFVQRGGFQIDEEGRIWRLQTLTRTGRMRPIVPRLAEKQLADGYSVVRLGRRNIAKAHRIVWMANNGSIPDGLEINHKNGLRSDNRLANLELVTPGENLFHAYRALGRWRPTGEKNGRSKLTVNEVTIIRKMLVDGVAKRAIARRFGISHTVVQKIAKGVFWRDELPPEVPVREVQA